MYGSPYHVDAFFFIQGRATVELSNLNKISHHQELHHAHHYYIRPHNPHQCLHDHHSNLVGHHHDDEHDQNNHDHPHDHDVPVHFPHTPPRPHHRIKSPFGDNRSRRCISGEISIN